MMRALLFFLSLLLVPPAALAQPYPAPYGGYGGYTEPPPRATRVEDKKTRFAEWLLPYIQQENQRLDALRLKLWRLANYLNAGYGLAPDTAAWLRRLAKTYKLDGDPVSDRKTRDALVRRVDVIPPSLALAQAAIESAWGQSRFTRVANNLFGIWTHDPKKGVLPLNRVDGKKHFVRKFADAGESLRYYGHLLNTQPAYRKLRRLRFEQRLRGEPVSGLVLAGGLDSYSARGRDYVIMVRNLIRQNDWQRYDVY